MSSSCPERHPGKGGSPCQDCHPREGGDLIELINKFPAFAGMTRRTTSSAFVAADGTGNAPAHHDRASP